MIILSKTLSNNINNFSKCNMCWENRFIGSCDTDLTELPPSSKKDVFREMALVGMLRLRAMMLRALRPFSSNTASSCELCRLKAFS